MAHDPLFEARLAEALKGQGTKAEPKKMFGGVAFMVNGNMSVGITNKGNLMVRFDPTRHAEILKWPGALRMTYGKGEMKGFVFLEPEAVADRRTLDKWVKLSLEHVSALPRKAAKKAGAVKATKKAAGKTVVRKRP